MRTPFMKYALAGALALSLAAGELSEDDFAAWLRRNSAPRG